MMVRRPRCGHRRHLVQMAPAVSQECHAVEAARDAAAVLLGERLSPDQRVSPIEWLTWPREAVAFVLEVAGVHDDDTAAILDFLAEHPDGCLVGAVVEVLD